MTLVLVACWAGAVSAAVYTNPVINADTPDPGVIWDESSGLYFAATTGGLFPLHASPDLATWSDAGTVFDSATWPSWADGTAWAPEIHYIAAAGHHVVYFVSKTNNVLCVGAAVSTTGVRGPYKDRGSPLIQAPKGSCFGVIDPTYYFDGTDSWVVWKEDGQQRCSC
jgi:beta-xylosidase